MLALGFADPAAAAVNVQLVVGGVASLVDIQHAGDGTGRLFLVRQSGQIMIYNGTQLLPTPFLDLSSLVSCCGEQGLLGLAFHPSYTSNGLFYVSYTNTAGDSVLARYHVSGDSDVADPLSGTIVLTQAQPFANHNGGQVRFGPDGFLYMSLGDGGSGGDPLNNGQQLNTLLGKLLRIDVNSGSPYAIPPTNPFVNTPGARGEIWAYGLRNPWRFSFDRQTGDLFIADVGQNLWEEVDVQPSGSAGGENYGWRRMEGRHCFNPSSNCSSPSLTLPVVEYSHSLGCSITGGFRYRGTLLTGHAGTYFFADYCTGRLWGATKNTDGTWATTQLLTTGMNITTFGEDESGEIFLSNYNALYRVVSAASDAPSDDHRDRQRHGARHELTRRGGVRQHLRGHFASGTAVTLTATPDARMDVCGLGRRPGLWGRCGDHVSGPVLHGEVRSRLYRRSDRGGDHRRQRRFMASELRARIDALRSSAHLRPFPWTSLSAGNAVLAVHVTEMRTAVNEVYAATGQQAPGYTDPGPAAGGVIKAVHISELRSAVLGLE